MTSDPHDTASIAIGTQVIGYHGETIGTVREVHPHYILVGSDGEHGEFDVPVHAIVERGPKQIRVSVDRSSSTPVDEVETAHRLIEES